MLFHLQINPGSGISIITHETDQLLQKTSIMIPGLVVHCYCYPDFKIFNYFSPLAF